MTDSGGIRDRGGSPSIEQIELPVRDGFTVNAWLLRGEPLTLVDTGPRIAATLTALEEGLRARGVRLEDIELVLATHHHDDHVGLAATIQRRSGARIAALEAVAAYGRDHPGRTAADRASAARLLRAHGVPDELMGHNDAYWRAIEAQGESYHTDVRLADGDRIRAGGRDLRVVWRPGHTTTDTLFVDAAAGVALVGDHLLAATASNTEILATGPTTRPRPASRRDYLTNLRLTAQMPLRDLLPGHGPPITDHAALIDARLAAHRRRSAKIERVVAGGPASAFAVAQRLWPRETVAAKPLQVVWEVVSHLDLLIDAGKVAEVSGADGRSQFGLAQAAQALPYRQRDASSNRTDFSSCAW
jgi:glyoxylase-like metal-dependent hydrolase (beta-lactamase superfamily II)